MQFATTPIRRAPSRIVILVALVKAGYSVRSGLASANLQDGVRETSGRTPPCAIYKTIKTLYLSSGHPLNLHRRPFPKSSGCWDLANVEFCRDRAERARAGDL